jgi:hypothetical protein
MSVRNDIESFLYMDDDAGGEFVVGEVVAREPATVEFSLTLGMDLGYLASQA